MVWKTPIFVFFFEICFDINFDFSHYWPLLLFCQFHSFHYICSISIEFRFLVFLIHCGVYRLPFVSSSFWIDLSQFKRFRLSLSKRNFSKEILQKFCQVKILMLETFIQKFSGIFTGWHDIILRYILNFYK